MIRTAFVAACLLAAAPASLAQSGPLALVGGKVLPVAGAEIQDGVVLIRDGRIERVGRELEVPPGYRRIDTKGGVIMPGMIDLNAYAGGYADLLESVSAVTPDVRAIDAFDPWHPDLSRLPASGVTTFVLAPRPGNVIAGRTAVLKSIAPSRERVRPRMLRSEAAFLLSVGRAAAGSERPPTSRPGVIDLLRRALARARGSKADERWPGLRALQPLLAGQEAAFIHVEDAVDARAAVAVATEFGLNACLVNARDIGDAAESVARSGAAVAFGPFDLGMLDRQLSGPARVGAAGGRVAFVSNAPLTRMADIRVTAALAVRFGLDRETALRGLTLTAAELAGVGDRVGSLEPGKDADLIVLSGDPLELVSRILRVVIDGETVYAVAEGGKDQHRIPFQAAAEAGSNPPENEAK
jgi:imidazolonepropionase-like amidohydrolase